MNDTTEETTTKRGRPSRTLAEEIAATKERLRQLEERAREQAKAEKERNQRAVIDLIKAEKLSLFSAEAWKSALPQIRSALEAGSGVTTLEGSSATNSGSTLP